ncbi:MAG: histidine--tRNA ligase [Chloroflexota bacterium]
MKHSALKGMEDILPPEVAVWQHVESAAREIFGRYGYQEMKLPVLESTDLFIRSIGETTDIVEKEMYTFTDKGGRSVTLRPEGTASAVRCYIENNLYTLPAPQKYYYSGPMFRYERPQKGRFRQFYQTGVEALGNPGPMIDAEIIAMLANVLRAIGLQDVSVELNSIGCEECRPAYRQALLEFFSGSLTDFCPDCQRRYGTNPLRILDCKVERCIDLRQGAPLVVDSLCAHCRQHFDEVRDYLELLQVSYVLNPNLVRGLDYYTRTTFEVTSLHLGAQKAVAAGGRYDRLVEEFGGPPTPAIGFAMGMERIVTLLRDLAPAEPLRPKVFIATLGSAAEKAACRLAETLRAGGFWVEPNYGGASLKSQLRKADRLGAEYAIIIGEDELSAGKIKWKNLSKGTQGEAPAGEALSVIEAAIIP